MPRFPALRPGAHETLVCYFGAMRQQLGLQARQGFRIGLVGQKTSEKNEQAQVSQAHQSQPSQEEEVAGRTLLFGTGFIR